MFGIAGTAELSTFCPGTGTWNRLHDGIADVVQRKHTRVLLPISVCYLSL